VTRGVAEAGARIVDLPAFPDPGKRDLVEAVAQIRTSGLTLALVI
jgi:hypothetical protein